MAYNRITWAAKVLRDAGLSVFEEPGWRDRGLSTSKPFEPEFVVWHHDASAIGDSPGVPAYMIANMATHGAQIWVCAGCNGKHASGTWHLVASGRMAHAGDTLPGMPDNFDSIGIETDHTTGEVWEPGLLPSLRKGTAALLRHMRKAQSALHFHKTICDPPGRKVDPAGLSLTVERANVGTFLKAVEWAPEVGIRSDLSLIQEQFQKIQGLRDDVEIVRYNGVGRIQQELNERGAALVVDGKCDVETVTAWKKYEASLPATKRSGSLGTPDPKSLATMGLIFAGPEAVLPKVRIRVGIHNTYVKRTPAEVNKTYSDLLTRVKPHIVLLQETAQMYGKWNIPGYAVIQFAPVRKNDGHVIETSSNTVLVRNDVDVLFKALLALQETWKGPKVGALHDPRAPITTTIEVSGKQLRLLDVHGPFGEDSVAEFNAEIVDWVKNSPYPTLAGGDYNQAFDKVMDRVASSSGSVVDGKAPDMVVIKRLRKVASQNHGRQGSDTHDFKTFDVEI